MATKHGLIAIAVASALWLGAGAAVAQTSSGDKYSTDTKSQTMDKQRPTSAEKSTRMDRKLSTGTDQMMGRHSMEGEITSLDAKKGWVNVKTSEGTMIVQVPPASLEGLKKGDTVTVDLAMAKAGEKAK